MCRDIRPDKNCCKNAQKGTSFFGSQHFLCSQIATYDTHLRLYSFFVKILFTRPETGEFHAFPASNVPERGESRKENI